MRVVVQTKLNLPVGTKQPKAFELRDDPAHPLLIAGRGTNADVHLDDASVSRAHLEITVRADGLLVRDLGSSNGTYVNRQPVPPGVAVLVRPGSRLQLGDVVLGVEESAASAGQAGRGPIGRVALPVIPAPIVAPPVVTPLPSTRAARPTFPNYMQMEPIVPLAVWHVLRVISVLTALMVCLLLFVRPDTGLFLFWRVLVPVLPLVFFVAPGLWRNICPMAALNQTPRLFGFTRGLTLPSWLKEYGYVIGIGLFLVIVPSRKVLFDTNGPALGLLALGALGTAFTMGTIFKGKSGWCSSICPLLPVQRIYGQTPFLTVGNRHCQPCVGCTKNCYDFNPAVAYLADLADDDNRYSGYRKFFAGAFPGLIAAFYTLPTAPDGGAPAIYARFALYIAVSLGSFFLLDSFYKGTANRLTALYAMAALNLYYWFNLPLLTAWLQGLAGPAVQGGAVWTLRLALFALTGAWVIRTYRKEPLFVTQSQAPLTARVGGTGVLALHRAAQAISPEVTFQPEDKRFVAEPDVTLLDLAESNELRIESGCRMGMCGADPVAILAGMEHLSAIGDDERTTLERLGLAGNTRLACCARVRGPVTVSLKPERPKVPSGNSISFKLVQVDPEVNRVVVIGNGIAGVTAADHVRRRHPRCTIDLVGRESHHLYNRMGISRLIYGRSAMQGLYLLPESWYEEYKVTTWLNTRAVHLDRAVGQVTLGTGETLGYDRLILAPGSSSTIPPIVGAELPGTFVLREASDAMAIRAYAQERRCRHAVIAGGGLLGLEAGHALHKLGLRVTVLERSDWLLRRQLDARAGQFLREYLQSLGLEILLRAETAAIQGDTAVRQVVLNDGQVLPCDLFLVCAGITPNVDLAREAGLAIGRGIVVDDHLRTSAPGIYAVGDVAEYRGQISGLWPVAVEQAEVAATNVVGGDKAYTGTVAATALKVVGVELASIGRFEPQSAADTVIAFEAPAEHRYRKLVLDEQGRIAGAILLGFPQDAPAVIAAVKKRVDVTPHLRSLEAGDWRVLSAGR